jgi:hypothetical protein
MKDKNVVSPVIKTLAREVSKEELAQVSGAGTVVKTSSEAFDSGFAETEENTYNKDGKYIGSDTIVSG